MNKATTKNDTYVINKDDYTNNTDHMVNTENAEVVKEPVLNRAQRRAQAKQQKKYSKMIQKYILQHPEAVKVDINEEAINQLDKDKNIEKLANATFDSVYSTK